MKKGFTLIELLAVIVILAVISLITTPMILGVIEDTKLKAAEQSANGYLDAVEKQTIINQVANINLINDGVYDLPMENVEVKGSKPTGGWLVVKNGEVINYSMILGEYTVTKGHDTVKGNTIADRPGPTMIKAGTGDTHKGIVYLDPTDLTKKCDAENSISTTETKIGCMKWYIYNTNENSYLMILDHNTTAVIAWNSTGTSTDGMKEVSAALANDTANWNSSLNARLITADEIASISGNTEFNSSTSKWNKWFYLDSNNQTQTATSQGASKYAWLFDYTNECLNNGCNIADNNEYVYNGNTTGKIYGYWTSSPVAGGNRSAWLINRYGYIFNIYVDVSNSTGVRPVITIPKSIISQ